MSESADKKSVVVNIGGKEFKIKGDADESLLLELAAYVDGKMKEIKDKAGVVDLHRLAVLAALNIAEELHNLKSEKAQAASREMDDKLAEMNALVDTYLQE